MRTYLVVGQVAERLQVSVRTVHELTRSSRIPHRRIGRRCLFLEAELDAWADGAELEVVEVDGRRAVMPIARTGR
jgi:excisionase family DNA binding protein